MGTISLDDILTTPLVRIQTEGGEVMHAIKQIDAGYSGFGEAYFSTISSGSVKAWKRHTRMTMNVVVPVGQVRFVFGCMNTNGAETFRVEEIGEDSYRRITVPPGIWFGFQGLAATQSIVLNIANISHDPNEVERLVLADINYEWK